MMKAKVILWLLAGVLVLGGVVFCSSRVIRNRDFYSSASDVFFHVLFLFEDRTEYAPAYSENKFKSVDKGMSKDDVRASLGEPLGREIYTNGVYREYWRYTKGPPDSSYWSRVITFDQRGIVQDVERKYFVD